MKKYLFLLFGLMLFWGDAQAEEDYLIFNFGSEAMAAPMTGSGSSVIDSWDIVYKNVEKDSLAKRFYRRVHRNYANNLKGWGIGWKWTESDMLDEIKARTDTMSGVPLVSELEAFDSLYINVPTSDLAYYLRFRVHRWYAEQKGFSIFVRTEAAYIERLKTLLGSP